MAVSKQQKSEILEGLIEKIKNAKSIGFASTNGLTVEDFSNLRSGLYEVNSSYNLAKKTLIKKAVKDALDIEIDLNTIPGQVGIVCSNDDAVAGLGKVNSFIKEITEEKMVWCASIFEGELKNLEETKVIASMPSRDTLLGRLVGSLQSPLSSLARFLDAASKDLEEKGKNKVGELEGDKEEIKKEEVKEEKKEETPKEEIKKEETKVEEKKEETKTEEK